MPGLNKIIYTILSLVLAALVVSYAADVWQSHTYIKDQGTDGVLTIGQKYNASRWAEPLPLKKLHVYTATLAPRYQVVIETDQELAPHSQVFIRHLALNDPAVNSSWHSLRPVSGHVRMRLPEDKDPVATSATAPLDKAVNAAMGDKEPAPSANASYSPDMSKDTAAFIIGGAKEGVFELIWNNSRPGEWIAFAFALFLLQSFAINAWTLPWRERKPSDEDKDFVHPSLQTIDADAPRPPAAKIAFKPKPKEPEPEPAKPADETPAAGTLRLPRK